ncbi:hypothetical protein HDE_13213 [Halotydeus destructor]|nr:hypothetical protein HDE_13213 [Halotydeus destructor]
MPAKPFTAPKTWKRPATRIYSDNYRFGNSLYSGAVADLDNKAPKDRPVASYRSFSPQPASNDAGVRRALLEADLGLTRYENSEMYRPLSANKLHAINTGAPGEHVHQAAAGYSRAQDVSSSAASSARDTLAASRSLLDSSYSRAAHSSASALDTTFSTYASAKALANVEAELDEAKARRRRQRALVDTRPESYYTDDYGRDVTYNEGSANNYWMERCSSARNYSSEYTAAKTVTEKTTEVTIEI